jgi:hypothetical protein
MRISIEYQANKDIFLSFVDFLRSMLGYFTLPLQREDNQIMVLALLPKSVRKQTKDVDDDF